MDIVIVGAGPCGLTASYNLIKKIEGCRVLLVERNARLGGLARSFTYEDQFVFDIGPKRFHTDRPEVLRFLKEVGQGLGLLDIDRSSKVAFLNRFFDWPLGTKDVFRLPPVVALKAMKDMLAKPEISREDMLRFEGYIVSQYGRTLYEIFFKPYTEKFLFWKVEDIHADWASTGINRSIINEEHKGNSLLELISQVLLPKKVDANFLYPARGGFGGFWDYCAELTQEMSGGRFQAKAGATVTRVQRAGERLALTLSDQSEFEADMVLWTGRLDDLLGALDTEPPQVKLPYLDTVFWDLVFEGSNVIDAKKAAQWTYISSAKYKISRVSMPQLFSRGNSPEGYQSLCVEVTAPGWDPDYVPDTTLAQIESELIDLGLVAQKGRIATHAIHRENATYPVYYHGYKQASDKALKAVQDFSPAVVPMGRCGCFWYNNCDHSITHALVITDQIAARQKPEFDFRKLFGGISEVLETSGNQA